MRVLRLVPAIVFLVIYVVGCAPIESDDIGSDSDVPLDVDLSHVDEEVREFLVRKQKAVQDSPQSSAAIGELAMAYEMNGFADAALIGYRNAKALAPTNPKWPYFEGLLLASFGDYEDALVALDQMLKIDGEYAPGWVWKGRWHLEFHQLEEATEAFERARELGQYEAGQVGLAQVALRRDRPQDVLNLLEDLHGGGSHPQVDGLIQNARRRLDLADDTSRQPSSTSPGQFGFADPLSAEKRTYEVSISAELTRFRELIVNPERHNAAIALVDSLYEEHPQNKRVVIAKAHGLRLKGDFVELRTLIEQAHKTWPNDVSFKLALAELEIGDQNKAAATGLLDEVLDMEPTNAWGLLQRGILFAQEGKFAEAITSLQQTVRQEESAEIHYYLGHAYAELADWTRARCHMSRVLELDPEFPEAKHQLARLVEIEQNSSPNELTISGCSEFLVK